MSVSAHGMAAFFIISVFTTDAWRVFLAQAVIGFSIRSRLVDISYIDVHIGPVAYVDPKPLPRLKKLSVPVQVE